MIETCLAEQLSTIKIVAKYSFVDLLINTNSFLTLPPGF